MGGKIIMVLALVPGLGRGIEIASSQFISPDIIVHFFQEQPVTTLRFRSGRQSFPLPMLLEYRDECTPGHAV